MYWAIVGALLLAITLSLDAFAAAFAYGCNQIKIPPTSGGIIAIICTATTGASFLVGAVILPFVPSWLAALVAFLILFIIGCIKLFDALTKSLIRKYAQFEKALTLSFFNLKLILHIYADPENADVDVSKSISKQEATILAVSLSLDGFAVGLGAALLGLHGGWVVFFCLIANSLALFIGGQVGNYAAQRLRFNISWLAGVLLIVLAFTQFL